PKLIDDRIDALGVCLEEGGAGRSDSVAHPAIQVLECAGQEGAERELVTGEDDRRNRDSAGAKPVLRPGRAEHLVSRTDQQPRDLVVPIWSDLVAIRSPKIADAARVGRGSTPDRKSQRLHSS